MSKMYGKRRVVLEQKPTHLGNRLVVICGSSRWTGKPGEFGAGGLYAPLGYWYQEGGLFYVDLKSREQEYESVSRDTIARKRLGGLPTKKALRAFVMEYWNNLHEAIAIEIAIREAGKE